MRTALILSMLAAPAFAQQVYSWEDKDGVHYTDDPAQVPKSKKVTKETLAAPPKSGGSTRVEAMGPAPETPSPAPAVAASKPGLNEQEWRQRFIDAGRQIENLKQSITALERSLPPQTTCALQAVVNPTTGVATGQQVQQCGLNPQYTRMVAELEQKRVALKDAEAQVDRLDREATRMQVPREWRRGW